MPAIETPETIQQKSTAHGRVHSVGDGAFDLAVPGSDYRIHLLTDSPVATPIGKAIRGLVRARARRVDVVKSGGLFIEPVMGRPRRVQGRIVAMDKGARTITVNAGPIPIALQLNERQTPDQFEMGAIVACDVEPGAVFMQTA